MKLICFGDSLTFGSVGHSYVKYLRRESKYAIRNCGVNGDTVIPMYSRLNKYLKIAHKKQNMYIICIGVNDLVLPYLSSVSALWKIQMAPRVKMMNCIMDNALFKQQYRKIIDAILSNNQKLIVLGLPYLELKNFPNNKIDERNKIIKELAVESHIQYIDINCIQEELSDEKSTSYSWKYKNFLRMIEGIVLPFIPILKDYLSKKRQLNFTTDGLHWNSKYAKAIASKISAYL